MMAVKTVHLLHKSLDVDDTVKALHPRTLGEDLAEHIEKGGQIIGHNIKSFDHQCLEMHWIAGLLAI